MKIGFYENGTKDKHGEDRCSKINFENDERIFISFIISGQPIKLSIEQYTGQGIPQYGTSCSRALNVPCPINF